MICTLLYIFYVLFGSKWDIYVTSCNTKEAYKTIVHDLLPLNTGRIIVLYLFTRDVIKKYPQLGKDIITIFNNEMSLL
jgi:hypothetical protein